MAHFEWEDPHIGHCARAMFLSALVSVGAQNYSAVARRKCVVCVNIPRALKQIAIIPLRLCVMHWVNS